MSPSLGDTPVNQSIMLKLIVWNVFGITSFKYPAKIVSFYCILAGYEDKLIEKLRKVEDIHVWKKGCPELKALHYTNNVRIQEIVVAATEGGCILNSDKLPSYPKYPFGKLILPLL